MRRRQYLLEGIAAALLLAPAIALGHDGASLRYGSFLAGLTHPVLGFDHLLAMVSVGIVSAQLGGRAVWTVPASFVAVMAVGGLLGLAAIGLPAIDLGIALSVLGLGVAIALDRRLPLPLVMTTVGFFAVFHGYAHGAEMPTVARPLTYALGFLAGTAALHLCGLLIGDIARRYARGPLTLRVLGVAVANLGIAFLAIAA